MYGWSARVIVPGAARFDAHRSIAPAALCRGPLAYSPWRDEIAWMGDDRLVRATPSGTGALTYNTQSNCT